MEKCNARLTEVNTALLTAEEDLRYLLDGYDEDRKRIQEEIDLFDWLIRHYQGISEPEPDARRADEEGEEDSEVRQASYSVGRRKRDRLHTGRRENRRVGLVGRL